MFQAVRRLSLSKESENESETPESKEIDSLIEEAAIKFHKKKASKEKLA